jgi:hypothetical protein
VSDVMAALAAAQAAKAAHREQRDEDSRAAHRLASQELRYARWVARGGVAAHEQALQEWDAKAQALRQAGFNPEEFTPKALKHAVSPYDANEVTGTNWASGGVALTGTTFTGSSGTATFDATDVSVATTTITNARGYLLYADALAGNNCLVLVNFGADYSTVAGTFSVTWHANGIFTVDLTP